MADDAQAVELSTGLRSATGSRHAGRTRSRVAWANFKWIEQTNARCSVSTRAPWRGPCWTCQGRGGDRRQGAGGVQSRFYADLARSIPRDPDSERLQGRVQFTAIRMMEEKLAAMGRRT